MLVSVLSVSVFMITAIGCFCINSISERYFEVRSSGFLVVKHFNCYMSKSRQPLKQDSLTDLQIKLNPTVPNEFHFWR